MAGIFLSSVYLPIPTVASLLNIWNYFHITLSIALRDMEVSSPVGAAYMGNCQHHSPNPGLILQVFRHHGQWQATA